MIAPHRSAEQDGPAAPRSVFQYVDVLRDRWVSALVAFGLVAGAVAAHALFSTPTYESRAMIQLDTQRRDNDPLAELALANTQANVEAELEVMASRSVAARAAVLASLGAIVQEENAYRPWESLLRGFDGGAEPVRLDARVLGRPMPRASGTWRLEFYAGGDTFRLSGPGVDAAAGPRPFDARTGAEFDLAGERVRIEPLEGDPAGRRFVLQLRTEEQAAAAAHGMGFAEQVGSWTGIVHLGAKADDPHLAQRVAAALARSYLELKQDHKDAQVKRRIEWLDSALATERSEVTKALDARDAYVTAKGAILLGEKAAAAFEAQSALFAQRLQQEQVLMEERAALEALHTTRTPEKVMAALGATNVDPQTRAVADSLVQLEVQRGALLRRGSTAADPNVKRVEAEIAELRAMLDRRIVALRGEVEAQIGRRIEAVQNRLQQIREETARHRQVLAELPDEQRALAELSRRAEAAQKRYAFLEQMKGEAELALSSTLTRAYEVDAALLNTARQSPVLFRRALMALFLGLFAAVGMALLRHLRDRSVQTPRDLEEGIGLPLYATIPNFTTVPRRERRDVKSSLVVRDAPTSTLAEHYRTLRANLRFADTGAPIRTLTITSAMPREGKTVTTLNLAVAMARAGNAVLVVDADLRRPMVHEHLEGPRSPGFTNVLRGEIPWREAVRSSGVPGLRFLPAGRPIQDPGALLEAGQFDRVLAEMREEFEYVLFDVPPVLAVADAAAFFRSLDGVLLVSRQGVCPLDVVDGAREQVTRFGGNLLGSIFNGFDARRAGHRRYGYSGYYGYQGYYGHHAETDAPAARSPGRGAPRADVGEAVRED